MAKCKQVQIGNLTFECLESGDPSNPLVILLHGFPESSFMWRTLMDDLSTLGFYCIAPDQRGYSPGACPKGKENYSIDKLAQDVVDIASAHGKQFHLIAHDWGAAIGWYIAYHHKESVLSYASLSVPHNSAFGKAFRLDKIQKKKSRYILWFLLPFLPEWYVSRNDFAGFKTLWKHADQEEVEHYLSIFRRKKSLTAALNYYRANIRKGKRGKVGKIDLPVLFIWGNRDLAIGRMAAEFNHDYMSGPYRYKEVNGGHWLIQSNYGDVKEEIVEHLLAN